MFTAGASDDSLVLRGPEVVAEVPQSVLEGALCDLLPSAFVAGDDPATPNGVRAYRRSRQRAASIELELPLSLTAFDLHAGAEALARNASAHVAVWTDWPEAYLVEYGSGVEISRLDGEHNDGWRGTRWRDIEDGSAVPLFPAALADLLRDHDDGPFLGGLVDWAYGRSTERPAAIDVFHHRYTVAPRSEPLERLARAIVERARTSPDEEAEIVGLGAFYWRPGDGDMPPALGWHAGLELREFFAGREPLAIELDGWDDLLSAGERAAAIDALTGAVERVTTDQDVVVPGILCLSVKELPGYVGHNPRTGQRVEVPPAMLPGAMFTEAFLRSA